MILSEMTLKRTFLQLLILTCALTITLSLNYLYAWTGPTGTAPANNVDAPINVGTASQVKDGNISVGRTANTASDYGLISYGRLRTTIGGVEFPDGTVQTTAASGTGSGLTVTGGGYIPASSNTANLGNNWTAVHFSGYDNDSDKGAAGGFIYKLGGTTYARLYAAVRHGEFTVTTTQQCVNIPNAPASDDVLCAHVDASGNLLIRTGTGIILDYIIYN